MKSTRLSRGILLFVFLIGSALTAMAQLSELTVGKVYHFVNANYPGKALGVTSSTNVVGVAVDATDYNQLWYVTEVVADKGVRLRNLRTGNYLQGNGQSANWSQVKVAEGETTYLQLKTQDTHNVLHTNTLGDYAYAHIDGSNNVVGWEKSSPSTQWTVAEVTISDKALQEAWAIIDNINPNATTVQGYQAKLDALFADKACTQLRDGYKGYTEAQMRDDANYQALPTTLQNMVLKVLAGDDAWAENNYDSEKPDWDATYAKKYRVQLYEPYNEPENAASVLRINAHTNLNNPTGIFLNELSAAYIMVEGKIEEGATLYVAHYNGHGKLGGYREGTELHEGLNVVPYYSDGSNLCINYVVTTFDTTKKGNAAKLRKLTDFPNLKIHIEGGHINGYYNKVGDELYPADKNADWEYLEERATQTDITVLGKYITLQFPLLDANTVDENGNTNKGLAHFFNDVVKIEDAINEWDNVMLWQRITMGLMDRNTTEANSPKSPYSSQNHVIAYNGANSDNYSSDYSEYYNIHGLSYGTPNNYMYGSWDHCGYNFNTMGAIIGQLPTNAGTHWGPAHEIGHQHQGPLNMRGLTEVTNNFFSNVVLWYYGETTSRVNGTEGSLTNVLKAYNTKGGDFYTNNIWAQTHLYYKLFLYYHVLGHNNKFYPRLFEMLRQDPMTIEEYQDGAKSLLHFYQKCCEAANEDLTEFFRAYGFFEVMKNRFVGDYSNAVYNQTQEQIDNAIAQVKSKNYPENISVLFINDATGETIKSHKGDNLEPYGETTVCAEVGCYASYANVQPATNYTYAINGNTVTMQGNGGVGFAIVDAQGKILAFSDCKTFSISNECAALFASHEAVVKVLNADNTVAVATNVLESGNDNDVRNALGNLLEQVKVLLEQSDETNKKVGFYKGSCMEELQNVYTTAKNVYDNKTVAAYTANYDLLYQAYTDLQNSENTKVTLIDGATYRFINKAYPTLSMSADANKKMLAETTTDKDAQLWYLEPSDTEGSYYLKNKHTNTYAGKVSTGSELKAEVTEPGKDHLYKLQDFGDGTWAFVGATGLHCSQSQGNSIVGWTAESEATRWYITIEEADETASLRSELKILLEQANNLINEMGGPTRLQAKDSKKPGYLSCNALYQATHDADYDTDCADLLDGNTATYIHTDHKSNAKSPHYLQVDFGTGLVPATFKFSYNTRDNGGNCPTHIVVKGSNNEDDFTGNAEEGNILATFKSTDATNPIPTEFSTTPWTSHEITSGYRYIRFYVITSETSHYFVLSEFNIESYAWNETYISSETDHEICLTANNARDNAQQAYDNEEATTEELNECYVALNNAYNNLLAIKQGVNNATLNVAKAKLQALIDATEQSIEECGEVNYSEANGYTATVKENCGIVTPELLIATYKQLLSAQITHDQAKDTILVNYAIETLDVAHDKLREAISPKHTLTVGQYGYTSLYLPYATAIPEDVTAYIIKNVSVEGVATLHALGGNVLPAETGVIIKANSGKYTFEYTTNAAGDDVSQNLLLGSTETKLIPMPEEGQYYIFGQKGGVVGLYLAPKFDANGNAVAADASEATQVKVSANKVYLHFNRMSAAPSSIQFDFEEATDIDTVVNAPSERSVIYDIQGRRINRITTSGVYIINGKKQVIQIK